jgi:hypothetical protein
MLKMLCFENHSSLWLKNLNYTKQVPSSGLEYKHVMIINDDSSIVIKFSFKLIDATRGILYDRHMFIVQATEQTGLNAATLLTTNKHRFHT